MPALQFADKFADVLAKDEQLVWCARPRFISYITPAIAWGLLAIVVGISGMVFNDAVLNPPNEIFRDNQLFSFGIFLIICGVANMVYKVLRFDNTFYAFSDRNMFIRAGMIQTTITVINYKELVSIRVSTNFFDRRYNTGSVIFELKEPRPADDDSDRVLDRLQAIESPYAVFHKLKQLAERKPTTN